MSGNAGIMRNTGVPLGCEVLHCAPMSDPRFTDMLIDVSNSYARLPRSQPAVEFYKPAPLTIIGGNYGGIGAIISIKCVSQLLL
eukprot:m.5076 g.5076  ORF g.5076 m.5076 type:complete len:84 (-) comp3194_c0_seq2:674-925(-)